MLASLTILISVVSIATILFLILKLKAYENIDMGGASIPPTFLQTADNTPLKISLGGKVYEVKHLGILDTIKHLNTLFYYNKILSDEVAKEEAQDSQAVMLAYVVICNLDAKGGRRYSRFLEYDKKKSGKSGKGYYKPSDTWRWTYSEFIALGYRLHEISNFRYRLCLEYFQQRAEEAEETRKIGEQNRDRVKS